jgi:hypothetical protein
MPGLLGLLGIVFIVLKLVGVIAWSWFWVLAPFWGPLVLVFLLFVLGFSLIGAASRLG